AGWSALSAVPVPYGRHHQRCGLAAGRLRRVFIPRIPRRSCWADLRPHRGEARIPGNPRLGRQPLGSAKGSARGLLASQWAGGCPMNQRAWMLAAAAIVVTACGGAPQASAPTATPPSVIKLTSAPSLSKSDLTALAGAFPDTLFGGGQAPPFVAKSVTD